MSFASYCFSLFLEVFKVFKVVLESVQHFGYGVPLSNIYSVYITSTRELKYVADDLIAHCKRLQLQLEPEGKLLTLTYFLTLPEVQLDEVLFDFDFEFFFFLFEPIKILSLSQSKFNSTIRSFKLKNTSTKNTFFLIFIFRQRKELKKAIFLNQISFML